MKLALYTIICCCLFTMVLPLIREELNSSLRKRFKLWLESYVRRDLTSSLVGANKWYPDIYCRGQQNKIKIRSDASSSGLNVRTKRSTSTKTTGCNLGTCVYHDLLHQLYVSNKKPKDTKAPSVKIGPQGYGRRRRSLKDVTPWTGRQRSWPSPQTQ